jgi:phenol hydroxylase P0 protein
MGGKMSQVNTNDRWVRVVRETDTQFVEFEFLVADTDLCVELILPAPAFKEFCAVNRVRFLDQDGAEIAPDRVLARIK